MKNVLLAGAALVALIMAGPSTAADLGVRQVVRAPVYAPNGWSGFYIGAHAGYGWGHDPFNDTFFGVVGPGVGTPPTSVGFPGATLPGINSRGFVGGAQFGYNQQWGAWVGGLEIDISGANIKGSTAATATGQPPGVIITSFPAGTTTVLFDNITNSAAQSENFKLLGSARARIGWLVSPGLLLYGTGGLGWTRVDQSISETIIHTTPASIVPASTSIITASASGSNWEFGWVAGGGGEIKITDNWLFRVEYLHYDFGNGPSAFGASTTTPAPLGPATVTTTSLQGGHLTVDVVRAGLSLRFGNT